MAFPKQSGKRCLCMTAKTTGEPFKQNATIPDLPDHYSHLKYKDVPVRKGQIRILLLDPGHGTDPIRCTMESATLDENPTYEALSYCWGDATKERTITCHGYDVPITKSLFTALRSLRREHKQLRVWIDALCINQQDLTERSEQVAQMNEIYTKADNVISWLGEADTGDELVYIVVEDGVRRLHERSTPSKEMFQPYSRELSHDKTLLGQLDDFKALGVDLHTYEVFQAFHRFATKRYFFRAWITQEVLLAKKATLTCGKFNMDLDAFFETFHYTRCRMPDISPWPHFQSSAESEGLAKMLFARRLTRKGTFQDNVLSMIFAFFLNGETHCFEPLDRVYAFRGLISHDARESIVVDYSLEPTTLFRQVLVEYISRQEPSDYWLIGWGILFGNSGYDKQGVQLPSWVPDFSKPPRASEVLCYSTYNMLNGCEYADWQSAWIEGEIIAVRGLMVTRVSGFLRLQPPGVDLSEVRCDGCSQNLTYIFEREHFAAVGSQDREKVASTSCKQCFSATIHRLRTVLATIVARLRTLLTFIASSSTGQPYGEIHWKTRRALCLSVDHITCKQISVDVEALPDIWIRLTQSQPDLGISENWTDTHPLLQTLTHSDLDQLYSSYAHLLFLAGDNQGIERVFGMTEDGRCAWLPKEVEKGDVVAMVVISGTRTPTILREQENGCFRIVGSAYVERMMIGELLPDTEEELWDIWIC